MAEQKTKVADLPKDEQDRLLNEARELNLRGLFHTWNVETLVAKINEAKEKQGEQNPPANETPANETPTDETPADETPANETPADETPADETPANETPTDETPADETPANEQTQNAPIVEKAEGQAYVQQPAKEVAKTTICHICRSKVINGKCTGCGFQLKK